MKHPTEDFAVGGREQRPSPDLNLCMPEERDENNPTAISPTTHAHSPPISRIVSPQIQAVIVSPGGCGTTTLMNFLSVHCRINDAGDSDGLKHFPGPLLPLNPSCRFLYVYGDPVDACISLFRRGFASPQSRRLNRRLAGAPSTIGLEETIETYAAIGVDRIGLAAHFQAWFASPRPYPVAFVHYDSLWTSLPGVLEYLQLPAGIAAAFPERFERHGSRHLAPPTVERLESIYAPLKEEMARLGDFHVSAGYRGLKRAGAIASLGGRAAFPTLSWELSCRLPVFHRLARRLHAAVSGRRTSS